MIAKYKDDIPSEVCDLHDTISEGITTIKSDIKWMLKIGYIVLAVSGTLVLSLWSFSRTLGSDIEAIKLQVAVTMKQIDTLEKTDKELKDDHLALRQSLKEVREKVMGR
jgi:hypothetical protein